MSYSGCIRLRVAGSAPWFYYIVQIQEGSNQILHKITHIISTAPMSSDAEEIMVISIIILVACQTLNATVCIRMYRLFPRSYNNQSLR